MSYPSPGKSEIPGIESHDIPPKNKPMNYPHFLRKKTMDFFEGAIRPSREVRLEDLLSRRHSPPDLWLSWATQSPFGGDVFMINKDSAMNCMMMMMMMMIMMMMNQWMEWGNMFFGQLRKGVSQTSGFLHMFIWFEWGQWCWIYHWNGFSLQFGDTPLDTTRKTLVRLTQINSWYWHPQMAPKPQILSVRCYTNVPDPLVWG